VGITNTDVMEIGNIHRICEINNFLQTKNNGYKKRRSFFQWEIYILIRIRITQKIAVILRAKAAQNSWSIVAEPTLVPSTWHGRKRLV
jgi:hypothetical protein